MAAHVYRVFDFFTMSWYLISCEFISEIQTIGFKNKNIGFFIFSVAINILKRTYILMFEIAYINYLNNF